MSRGIKVSLGIFVVIVIAAGAGLWYFVLRDTSDPTADLAALETEGPQGTGTRASADGTWQIQQGDNVFAGYRVEEVFAAGARRVTANGRTPAVEGSITIEGTTVSAVTITADVTQLKSDQANRDAAIRGRGLETERFPAATFVATAPVELPAAPAEGEEIQVTVAGELTLHGVTNEVEVPLRARWEGDRITVATVGEGIPIQFADYGMEPISVPIVTTEDNGTIELQLLFVPA